MAIVLALAVLLGSIAVRAHSTPPELWQTSQNVPAAAIAPPPAPVQPVPYSHKTHIALGLQCRNCHTNPDGGPDGAPDAGPDAGKLMTFPPNVLCMGCHQAIAKDRPSIQKLTELAATGEPIPWVRVYKLPDYVYWRHRTHLEAEVTCAECHGPVPERDVIALETNVTKMLGCVTCHDKRQAYTDCSACHAPRQ